MLGSHHKPVRWLHELLYRTFKDHFQKDCDDGFCSHLTCVIIEKWVFSFMQTGFRQNVNVRATFHFLHKTKFGTIFYFEILLYILFLKIFLSNNLPILEWVDCGSTVRNFCLILRMNLRNLSAMLFVQSSFTFVTISTFKNIYALLFIPYGSEPSSKRSIWNGLPMERTYIGMSVFFQKIEPDVIWRLLHRIFRIALKIRVTVLASTLFSWRVDNQSGNRPTRWNKQQIFSNIGLIFRVFVDLMCFYCIRIIRGYHQCNILNVVL